MALSAPSPQPQPEEPYLVDRFGEAIRPPRLSPAGVTSVKPEVFKGRSSRLRTVITVVWLVFMVPLVIGVVATSWLAIKNSGHTMTLSRLRMIGVKVGSRVENAR